MSGGKVVLVTGASGFLGGALCRALSGGFQVRAVVRRLSRRLDFSEEQLVLGELSANFDWSAALTGVDTIVHCAARVHVMHESEADPLSAFRAVNVFGTLNLASQAAKAGVRRFVFISSIGVNGGETFDKPFTVFDEPAPHTPYALSKFEAELALRELAEKTGMELVIIRPPLIYGPDAPGNFASLIRAVSRGLPLPFGAIVENRRSFVFLDNIVDFIVVCLEHPGAANRIFLVSDGEALSTAELVRRIGIALGHPALLVSFPVNLLRWIGRLTGKQGAIQSLCGSLEVDILHAQELLGWQPPVRGNEGLRLTAAYWLKAPSR